MRKILVSFAVAAAALAAVPAAAQYRDHDSRWQDRWEDRGDHRGDWNRYGAGRGAVFSLLRDLDQVENRIDRSARRGIISPREAINLRRESIHIRQRLHFAGRNGITGRELGRLQFQVNRLERHLRYERRDLDGRRG